MGLIKAISGSVGSVISDQWKEIYRCDTLSSDVILTQGYRVNTKNNDRSGDNVISNGSAILVADGQCMMIVEQGKVVEVCAEPGVFTYDTTIAPTIFTGPLLENVKKSFSLMVERFQYGGNASNDQRVYYVNLKEMIDNKYGTATPVPFRVVDQNIGLDIDISIRCNGVYSFEVCDPLLFYKNVAGNVQGAYKVEQLETMLKAELLSALQPAFAKISTMGIRYSMLPGHTTEICDALNQILSEKWTVLRGIRIVSFAINAVNASKEDEDMIKELQKTAVYRNANMAGAMLAEAQGEAMKAAAANEGQGSFMAFAGMNMAQNAGGIQAGQLFQQGEQKQAVVSEDQWQCHCGVSNAGKFCGSCGGAKPSQGWSCHCGTVNQGKFCSECGAQNTVIVCDKCGFKPESTSSLKFCPECGDVIDGNDKQ